MTLPMSRGQVLKASAWLTTNFGQEIGAAIQGMPVSMSLVCAIACKETGNIWPSRVDSVPPAELLRKTIFGPPEDSNFHIFATFLFTNNAGVAIIGYALGFAFGLPTMMLMFQQGLSLGALFRVFSDAGLAVDFLGWIAIHGTTELLAIFIAGGAGLKIGTAVAFPGARSRLAAAAEAGQSSGAAMIGVILMLLVAGLLEGFARQLVQDTALRYGIGGAMLAIWLAYYYLPRRRRAGTR